MKTSSEKPRITGSEPAHVQSSDAGEHAISGHRSDIFFAAIEATRMPMLVTDPRQEDNPVVFVNPAFISMSGYSADEVLGRNCRFLQGPDTDPDAIAEIREAVAARREVTTEILNYRKDGSTFWNALFVSPVFDEHKNLVYFFASQLDVSRRRDAEAALARSQRMEALGQLTGGISHDFNNLLQVISGHLDILRLNFERETLNVPMAKKSLQVARNAVVKAATLTQQLLAFSRKQHLEGRPVNLNAVAEGISDLVRETLGNGIDLRTVLKPSLPNCRVDPGQLEMSLLNILVNARDAMPQGGTVTIETAAVTVTPDDVHAFSGLRPGRYVTLSVTDSGMGIPPEIINRVMDPFFTTKEEGKGTGLGLSMVYGFAKQSGGQASIYSELDQGTTLRMYFPVTEDVTRSAELAKPSGRRGGQELILVVDDRPEVAALAQDMLDTLGYMTVVVGSGIDALDWFKQPENRSKAALLFTDVIMPGGINGFMLATEMRRHRPDLRVLLTTGYAGEETAHGSGGQEFEILRKPYTLDELSRKVRAVLDGAPSA